MAQILVNSRVNMIIRWYNYNSFFMFGILAILPIAFSSSSICSRTFEQKKESNCSSKLGGFSKSHNIVPDKYFYSEATVLKYPSL